MSIVDSITGKGGLCDFVAGYYNTKSTQYRKMSDRFHANTLDLYFLGIAIVIGGQIFSWNAGLVVGCWENLFAFFFIGMGYVCLVLCLSEMTSALPFSGKLVYTASILKLIVFPLGGVYGFIRATTGPYLGFVVGCCETMQNIIYVSATAIPLSRMITSACDLPSNFEPLFWLLFYVISLGINIAGGQVFWKFNFTVGCVSLLLILIYIFGTIQYADFEKYVEQSKAVSDHAFDGKGMMEYLPLAAWFFIGVEYLPLCGRDCSEVISFSFVSFVLLNFLCFYSQKNKFLAL
jgi:ethanolamine permease